ncbi:Chemotaxis protein histidine kinase and related kinases [Magnetospirillum gryphiswaldense MSR-1 v2]|uniref:Chemotaxis protein histidine kinase and related kinases n=1 Tax=Magnetospirillum gryphiswaldense (strain DSM 6361 / JCM 21280 / NBRC 15271 / MSR-1) TaxID=431944 RepID=V6F4Q4_MAGGM|nr:hypothetical protein [Magnetospirillum gryphiswaldense]CDL00357.1 Chemotaxis protein histidine kinase and related kinases [Magnetospirillum gryphiswaldense MSR-1 v2]
MAGGDALPDGLDCEALARAEAALESLSQDYPRWLRADLAAARACLTPSLDPDRLYTILHDIKGQATTFGYPLISRISQHLCRMLTDKAPPPDHIIALLDAMESVVDHGLTGDGGAMGRELLARLD